MYLYICIYIYIYTYLLHAYSRLPTALATANAPVMFASCNMEIFSSCEGAGVFRERVGDDTRSHSCFQRC